jgi:hypothetical protein
MTWRRPSVERGLKPGEGGTRPGMPAQMKSILVPLGFVLVLEAVVAVLTRILFLHIMRASW